MRADPGHTWEAKCLTCGDFWHVHEQPVRCECESRHIKVKQVSELVKLGRNT